MAYSYAVAGETVTLQVDPSVIAVKFAPGPASRRAVLLESSGIGPYSQRIELPREGLSIVPAIPLTGAISQEGAAVRRGQLFGALEADAAVEQARPVFRIGANQVIATDRVVLGVAADAAVDDLLERFGLTEISRAEERLFAAIPVGADVFEVVRAIDGSPGILYAEPDLIIVGRRLPQRAAPFPIVPSTVTSTQSAMQITKARQAWAVQPGNPAIRIAILDDGVDTAHPDLNAQIVGTYDATDRDSYQQPSNWDGHGTACAGLAAASSSAAGGVQGSGRGCSILAIRIAFSDFADGPWVTHLDTIAHAIDWAVANGADVISNSWSDEPPPPSSPILFAIERALTQGRGGRGCVVVAAAGNAFGKVAFPADRPGVLAVAASNEHDQAKTRDSADGETWWGSCFGPEVDVAAPGVHNLTTDISGSAGYATGNYAPAFNGTSAATPIVAGACGLILSRRPQLSAAQVREIITGTADKVGQFPYVGGRNDHMGWGRLNVLAAVQSA